MVTSRIHMKLRPPHLQFALQPTLRVRAKSPVVGSVVIAQPKKGIDLVRSCEMPSCALLLHDVTTKNAWLPLNTPHAAFLTRDGGRTPEFPFVDGNSFIFTTDDDDVVGSVMMKEAREIGDSAIAFAMENDIEVIVVRRGFRAVRINGIAIIPNDMLASSMRTFFGHDPATTIDMMYQMHFPGFSRECCNFLSDGTA